ncbi:MAG: tRNA (adenosine(37)-N6)-threonylcarbamoyltransferase complex dimerization subunit type 1 TsaB [Rhodobacteraceae bacterium]|nr:tRNA (adenosine(37)-N6)-threonylcarbamoyltransferase complex dimerization subunit type 1 TsaB [Paracoccaceae bacterium]|tara:strand:+ start:1439 stop:2137 length:699 start_codon:yes stop_codon:yes gene_type:complete
MFNNKILCIDTTSEFCSISLFENKILIENRNSKIERSHSKLIIKLIDDILTNNKLKAKELDAFSISKGPGSYTGLRIGLSSIKGFCYALDKPLIALNTLKVLAESALEYIEDKDSILCPMVDARRMEVYTKTFNYKLNEITKDQALILEKDSFENYKDKNVYFFGDGSYKFKEIVNKKNFIFLNNINPNSKFMGQLSYDKFINKDFEDLSSFEPNYIKDFYLIKKKGKWERS